MARNRRLWVSLIAMALIIVAIVSVERAVPDRLTPPAAEKGAPAFRVTPSGEIGPLIPDFEGIAGWIGSPPLSMEQLKGRVVLIDFWTYSCVNCLRTLPYLKEWHNKYASRGLSIVGVHSPEFAFERHLDNVRAAVERDGVTWPVALDNDFATWRAYRNNYWPHKYLADAEGRLRHHHIGEGAYREFEEQIRLLLTEAGYQVSDIPLGDSVDPERRSITRELYAGQRFRASALLRGGEDYVGNDPATAGSGNVGIFQAPDSLWRDQIFLDGPWEFTAESMRFAPEAAPKSDGEPAAAAQAGAGEGATPADQPHSDAVPTGRVVLLYEAASVNAVMRSRSGELAAVAVRLDGQPVPRAAAGDDLTYDQDGGSWLRLDESRMYNLLRHPQVETHLLELETASPDFMLYTFTFSAN